MTRCRTAVAFALLSMLALAGCDQAKDPLFQGWIEADLIFVAPDEVGRVETLAVQEGDQVMASAPLFSVDADLQKEDGDEQVSDRCELAADAFGGCTAPQRESGKEGADDRSELCAVRQL